MAWKNIWRNKKRTIIVGSSILFAVLLSSIMRSAQIGSFDYMIHSLANINLGYMQFQHPEYYENRSLNNGINISSTQVESIRSSKHIIGASYRLEAFGLLATDTLTEVGLIIGIDPENENTITELSKRVSQGEYINSNDTGILIGEGLAENLSIGLNDTIVFLGSGYHGQTAAALLVVKGLLKFPIKAMNEMMVYTSLKNAQSIFSMDNQATSLVINIDKLYNLAIAKEAISKYKKTDEVILTWDELMPEIKQLITSKNGSNYIMIGILYMIIGFGIFGVIMMMTMEREKEWGILNGIGMSKAKMLLVSFFENIFISLVGVVSGLGLSVPLSIFLANNPITITGEQATYYNNMGVEPIITFSDNADIFIYQALIVFCIAAVCTLYPLVFLTRLKIVDALKK